MKKVITVLAATFIGSVLTSSLAIAGPATDALGACLADNTTGKERKDMARWVYAGMSVHPEIRNLSNVTDKNRDDFDRKMAVLFTKLLTENCPAQAKLAMDKDGSAGFQNAFGMIGRLAMQELMSNPDVNASFTSFSKYVDQNKINAVFANK